MPISDFYKIKPDELDNLPLSDAVKSQVKSDVGYQAAHGLIPADALVANPPDVAPPKPQAPVNPANEVAFNPFAPSNQPGFKPAVESAPSPAPIESEAAPKPVASSGGGVVKPVEPIDSFDQYQSKVAGLDSQAASIDEAVANGTMTPQEALVKKGALDAQKASITSRDNYDENGNFSFANAAKNPKAYSYGRLKDEYVKSQFKNAEDQHKAGQAVLGSIQAGADATKARDEAVAAQYGEQAQVAEKNRMELEANQKNYEIGLAKMNQAKQSAVDDYTNTQIDPSKSWKNLGAGGGIFTAIIAGLAGAYANRAAGGVVENPIVKQMNTIIDRDIDAQKSQLAKKRDLVNIKDNDIAQFMKQGFDQKDAILMAQKVGWQKATALLDQTQAKYNSPIAQANYAKMKAEATQQQLNIDQQLSNSSAQMLLKMRAPTGTAGGTAIKYNAKDGNYYKVDINGKVIGLATPAEAKVHEQTNKLRDGGNTPSIRTVKFDADRTVTLPDGSSVLANNAEQAKTAQLTAKFAKDVKELTAEMRGLGPKIDNPITDADRAHNERIESLATRLSPIAGKLGNPSQQVSGPEQERMQHNLDPGGNNWLSRLVGWTTTKNAGVLDSLDEQADAAVASIVNLYPNRSGSAPTNGSDGAPPEKEDE